MNRLAMPTFTLSAALLIAGALSDDGRLLIAGAVLFVGFQVAAVGAALISSTPNAHHGPDGARYFGYAIALGGLALVFAGHTLAGAIIVAGTVACLTLAGLVLNRMAGKM